MNKKAIVTCLMLTLLLSMCGCQLAQPEGDNSGQADRLVGVFITTEHLDLIADAHLDAYLKDHAGSISDGDTIMVNTRVYATFVEEPYQDSDGEYHDSSTYEFENLDGIVLALYQVGSGEESYISPSAGEGICDVHSKIGGEDQGISGTIWMAKNSGEAIYYMNPIYQTADGQVYLIPGNGLHLSSDTGGCASRKMHEEVTITENEETYVYTFSVEVTIDFAEPAETVTIIQMNDNDEEIKRETFQSNKLPKQFTPEDSAAYLVVISESDHGIFRQINQPGEDKIEVFIRLGEQICAKNYIYVEWQ